jgi:protein phosphatase
LTDRRSTGRARPVTADVDCFGLTHQGQVRRKNDDHFLIASLHKLTRIHQTSLPDSAACRWCQARIPVHGGGRRRRRPHGDVASGRAALHRQYVTHLMDLYNRLDPDKETQFLAELEKSVQRSHEILVAETERAGEARGGATTLTMVAAVWPRAYLVQVGDSRCYRLRDGKLERMSQDQTIAQALVEQGALSPGDAEHSPLRNMLVSALGGREARPMTAITDIRWDDVMLICTDGLTKHVTEKEIEAELTATSSAEDTCRRLVNLALERGGTDNVTVLISRLRPRRLSGG